MARIERNEPVIPRVTQQVRNADKNRRAAATGNENTQRAQESKRNERVKEDNRSQNNNRQTNIDIVV